MTGITTVAKSARAAGCDEAADLIWRLVALIDDLADPDICHFDHHGYCQAHFWLTINPPCPHARARELIANRDADEATP